MTSEVKDITLYEVDETSPTGRKIILPSDCPIFAAWGPTGGHVVEEGSAAITTELFEHIAGIVKETQSAG